MISDEQRKQLNAWFRSSDYGVQTDDLNMAALYFAKTVMDAVPDGATQDEILQTIRVAWRDAVFATGKVGSRA